jgi:hypothetical protein
MRRILLQCDCIMRNAHEPCMPKDLGSIQTVALSIICSLTVVAWPAAALSGTRPQRGRPAGRLAAPRKNKSKEVLVYIYSIPSAIELHWHISYLDAKIIPPLLPGSARVLRAGVTGATQGRGGPPDPASAGDNL